MIIGKDCYKVKCFKGAIRTSSWAFSQIAEDLQRTLDTLKADGIDIGKGPYSELAADIEMCEGALQMCEYELKQ